MCVHIITNNIQSSLVQYNNSQSISHVMSTHVTASRYTDTLVEPAEEVSEDRKEMAFASEALLELSTLSASLPPANDAFAEMDLG